jgi:hypothetical protein
MALPVFQLAGVKVDESTSEALAVASLLGAQGYYF